MGASTSPHGQPLPGEGEERGRDIAEALGNISKTPKRLGAWGVEGGVTPRTPAPARCSPPSTSAGSSSGSLNVPPAPHGRPFAPLLAAASTKTILVSSFFFPRPQWPQRSLKARSRGTKWRNKNEARGAYRTCLSPGSWKDPRQRDILNNKFCDFTYLLELS